MSNVASELACPECSGPLTVGELDGERHYECPACGAVMCGTTLFGDLVGAARAQQIWGAAPAAPADGSTARCAFCGNLMVPASVPSGQVWLCRSCEMVVLDKLARGNLVPDQQPLPTPQPMTDDEIEADGEKHHGRAWHLANDVLEVEEAIQRPSPWRRMSHEMWFSGPTA